MEQFQQTVRIKPDHSVACYNLGVAFVSQGRFDEVAGRFRKAIQFDPDYVEAHYNLGNMLAARGQSDEAVEHYRRALVLANTRHDSVLTGIIQTRLQLCETNVSHLEKP